MKRDRGTGPRGPRPPVFKREGPRTHWKDRKGGFARAPGGESRDDETGGRARVSFAGTRERPVRSDRDAPFRASPRGDRDSRPASRFGPRRDEGERAFKPRGAGGEFRGGASGARADRRPPGRPFEKKPFERKREFAPRFDRDRDTRPSRPRERFAPRPACDFTHLNERGEAHMVDVGAKAATAREAVAEGTIRMQPETLAAILAGGIAKGDVLAAARIAGIMAAKKTAELIPLCHTIPLTHAEVVLEPRADENSVHCRATCATKAETGVEMEALLAAEVALLTIYDMCKAMDRGMEITGVRLLSKTGGQSGAWQHPEPVTSE
jgi:cyclic pyranopterin phosphate synthase